MKNLDYIIKPTKLGKYVTSVLKTNIDSYWLNIPSKFFDNLGIDKYDIEFEFMIDSDNRLVLVGPKTGQIKSADIALNSDNKILVAQPESQATSENKSPAKEIISNVR